ncbi:MAG TPA: BTAD domain-containing putative transcriptional regulator [Thermomonospora sp.]|nr:BTAD domain-containing putative transcriptional regulator [Thermomonospora sp.]
MRFGVLGPLTVHAADGQPIRIPERKVRALLADLLVHEGGSVSADRLIEDLWETARPRDPARALQIKVSRLRSALPDGRAVVVYGPAGYRLSLDADAVDAGRFQSLVDQARAASDPASRAALLRDALGLWRGPAFADFRDEPFAAAAIARLEERRLTALEDLAETRLLLGDHAALADELAAPVAEHPLRERLRAAHIRALALSGRQSEALTGYFELRERLRDDLGVDPSPELSALHQAILTGALVHTDHPERRRAPQRASTADDGGPRPGGLPAEVTELIGREDAVARVSGLVSGTRLVTLIGPGGVGKTRLALATAARAATSFPDGVWLVELAGTAGADVAEAVAAVLGVRDDGAGRPVAERVTGALRGRRALLVLDNCEHVVEPVAALVALLLRTAPNVHVLATSQVPLSVGGETVWSVPPLEQPSAVRLFTARARAAAPDVVLDERNAAAVAAICRRLDGIPLALELAATRVRAMPVEELAARLDDRFRLLAAGNRDAPPRQRTLRAMIDWSWEPLTGPERAVLRRLAVSADGCTLQAAEEICSGDGSNAPDVLDVLARLVDRSLVVRTGGRYRLLETVAAYGLERLREAGEEASARHRHLAYQTTLAEQAERHLYGHDQGHWLERLDAETANLRAALDHAVHSRATDHALRLVNALSWYWFLRGRLGEAHRSLTTALSLPGGSPVLRMRALAWQTGMAMLRGEDVDPHGRSREVLEAYEKVDDPGGRARARWFLAYAQHGYGDQKARRRRVQEALAEFKALGDHWGVAAARCLGGGWELSRGNVAAFRRAGETALELFRHLGDPWGQVQAVGMMADAAEIAGEYGEARRLRAEGLRIAEDLKLWSDVSVLMSGLGRVALLTGDHRTADELHERARRIGAEQGNVQAEQHAEIGLAMGARRRHDLDRAETHLRRWLDWDSSRNGDPGTALIHAELGFIAEMRGDVETALTHHEAGHVAARSMGDPRAIALALEGLAGAEALRGDHERAAGLLAEACALREAAGAPLPQAERFDVDRITAALRSGGTRPARTRPSCA